MGAFQKVGELDFNKSKKIKQEVVNHLNLDLKPLSKLLQDSTDDYTLFRCCLYMASEDEAILNLLASDIDGCWRRLELVLDFGLDDIVYDKKVSMFRNKRKILSLVDDIIYETLDKIPLEFDRLYFDLNHTARFQSGYLLEYGEDSYILLDNLQCYNSNYCFSDGVNKTLDPVLVSGWRPIV